MPLNFKQRAIFVYLRDKDDNRSCTPAGAKLTNEYTHRTNKSNPCTISVTPPQLCTFFRKRTPLIFNSHFLPRKIRISSLRNKNSPRRYAAFLRKNQMISPKSFTISSGENQKHLPRYLKIHRERLRWARSVHIIIMSQLCKSRWLVSLSQDYFVHLRSLKCGSATLSQASP